jgi:hypothetical protein
MGPHPFQMSDAISRKRVRIFKNIIYFHINYKYFRTFSKTSLDNLLIIEVFYSKDSKMPSKKQSCLAPFINEIVALRETIPPTPYTEIA